MFPFFRFRYWKRKPVSVSNLGNRNQFPFPIFETETSFHDVLATLNSIVLFFTSTMNQHTFSLN